MQLTKLKVNQKGWYHVADLKRMFSTFNIMSRIPEYLQMALEPIWKDYSAHRLIMADGDVKSLMIAIKDELMRAWEKHGHLNSAHEGYAVLLEEMDELKEHVWMKQSERNMEEMGKEALQVAAMAMKFYVDIIVENNRR